MSKNTQQELEIMKLRMETLMEKIEDVDEKLSNLTKQLLDPDSGFVSRVNKNTQFREDLAPLVSEMYDMKRWKETVSRVLWIVTAGVIAGLVKVLFFM